MKKKLIPVLLIITSLFSVIILIVPGVLTPPIVKDVMKDIESLDVPPGEILLDVIYKEEFLFRKQALDIYYPLTPASELYDSYSSDLSPVLVFIHGGSWIHGDKSMIRIIDPFLQSLRENGVALVSINYTAGLAGGIKKPVENCRDALLWLREKGQYYGLNTRALGLYGVSAGAHLAMMSVPCVLEDPDLELLFLLEEFGPVDLAAMAEGDAFEASGILKMFPESVLDAYSPLTLVDEHWPPVLMFHGTADDTVSIHQTELLADKLEEKGVPYHFQVVPGGDHGFFNMPRNYWRKLEDQCLSFMLPLVFPEEVFEESIDSTDYSNPSVNNQILTCNKP